MNENQDSASVNLKRFGTVANKAIDCENLLLNANIKIDSLLADASSRDTLQTFLYNEIRKDDKIIIDMQEQNEITDSIRIANENFIRQLENLKWRDRLFKQRNIIKVYLNNTP